RGDLDVNRVHVLGVAPPRDRLSGGGEAEAGQVHDRPGRPVLAGDPLRVGERELPGGDRECEVRVNHAARGVPRVDVEGGGLARGPCRRGREENQERSAHGYFRNAASAAERPPARARSATTRWSPSVRMSVIESTGVTTSRVLRTTGFDAIFRP